VQIWVHHEYCKIFDWLISNLELKGVTIIFHFLLVETLDHRWSCSDENSWFRFSGRLFFLRKQFVSIVDIFTPSCLTLSFVVPRWTESYTSLPFSFIQIDFHFYRPVFSRPPKRLPFWKEPSIEHLNFLIIINQCILSNFFATIVRKPKS